MIPSNLLFRESISLKYRGLAIGASCSEEVVQDVLSKVANVIKDSIHVKGELATQKDLDTLRIKEK